MSQPNATPYEAIMAQYHARPEEKPFEWYVDWHLRNGFVFGTPNFFVMGFPCHQTALVVAGAAGPHRMHLADARGDCWYISAMAGNMHAAWSVLPWPTPWMAWDRDLGGEKELRFHATERIRSLSGPPTP